MSHNSVTHRSLTRRDFVQGMTAATLAALACSEPGKVSAEDQPAGPPPTADACILLWMAGGMAAPET